VFLENDRFIVVLKELWKKFEFPKDAPDMLESYHGMLPTRLGQTVRGLVTAGKNQILRAFLM